MTFYKTAYSLWGDEEQAAIDRVRASGQWTMAGEVETFEAELAEWHGVKHAIMVNSGSSANLIAVAALFHVENNPLKRGDTALVPAIAWSTTFAPLVQHGLKLKLVDCDATWNAANADTAKLSVICSILGNPTYPLNFSGDYVIEDNCESLGASVLGKKCGTFGFMGTLSFFYSHQLSAIEGGAILTNSDECARLCKMLRAHGWTRDVAKPESFDDEYDFRLMGYNVRPLELHAAIGRAQLKKQETFRRQREQNWRNFETLSARLPIQLQARNPHGSTQTNPFGMAFTVESSVTRARLVAAFRANEIDCRLPTGGSFRKHIYGKPWADQQTPAADYIHECGLFLGNAPFDLAPQIERAIKVMRETL